jgi:hypothetical protein
MTRSLTTLFYLWLAIVALVFGSLLGLGAAQGLSQIAQPSLAPGAGESEREWTRRFEDQFIEQQRRADEALFWTIPLGVLLAGVVAYRLGLYRSIVEVDERKISIAGLLGTIERARAEVTHVGRGTIHPLGWPENVYVVAFSSGRSAILRPAFIANASELAEYLGADG